MAAPNPLEGALGGWWFFSTVGLPFTGTLCLVRAEIADTLADLGGFIAAVRVVPGNSTSSGGVWTAVAYTIRLRYQSSSVIELVSQTPIPDPVIGHATSGVPRNGWAGAWRFALTFRCSTFNPATNSYAADGFVQLFLNGSTTPLLSAVDVVIPRRLGAGYGDQVRYSVAANGDCDRVWARSVADVPPTTSEGAFTSGTPSQLVYFEEFDSGAYPGWTPVELTPDQPGTPPDPHSWSDCGGDNGWGISSYACGPSLVTGAPGVVNHQYAGLWRVAPVVPVEPVGGDRIEACGVALPIDPVVRTPKRRRY
jgi:hypothetical protein